jgi:uncharacterized membrane protein YbhN (UPF0104 family)
LVSKRKIITVVLTVGITAYLIFKVYSEASRLELSWNLLLSPFFLMAVLVGLASYLLYTSLWYVCLRGGGVDFRRTFLATLSGTYLGFSLNSAVGILVKIRLLGTDYWYTMGAGLLAMATEYLSALTLLSLLGKNPVAGFLALVLGFLMVFDRIGYNLLLPIFHVAKSRERLDRMYKGWKEAKSGSSLLTAFIVGLSMVSMNALTLFLVGRALGRHIPYWKALKGVLYSTFLGGVLGTPGGIGANELGVTMAIGNDALAIIAAFLYKILTTYAYALAGAVAFYRIVSHPWKTS